MPLTKPLDDKSKKINPPNEGGGGDDGDGGANDPLIQAVIQKLPPKSPWPLADRVTWIRMLVMAFDVAYGIEGPIVVGQPVHDDK